MSSTTVVFFPLVSKESELTPLDIAALERAAWQLEAMNALLAESSLPLIKDGKISRAGDRILSRSDPPNVVADESIKYAEKVSPPGSPELTLIGEESSPSPAAKKAGYVHGRADDSVSVHTSSNYIFGPSPSAASNALSETSFYEDIYDIFLAPLRVPFAPKDANAPSPAPVKTASHLSKVGGRSGKENQTQPLKLARRKAVRYPLGVRPTQAVPIKTVTAFRSKPIIFESPKVAAHHASRTSRVNYQDFAFRHLLGSGSQGRVYLARYHRDTRSPLLAVKVLKKGAERDTECVMQEHKVLKRLRGSPFVLSLQAAFNDSLNWYLVTDYHCGGDLQKLLFKKGRFDEDTTRFYASEMISALKFLHSHGIIHRDLKLANVLLRKDGHISIADYGLVHDFEDGGDYKLDVEGNPMATGCCGTRTHMAPEVLEDKVYTYSADWWSFGVCLFTMLQGELPWEPEKIGWSGTGPTFCPLVFNSDISPSTQALSLIHGLLQKLPYFRMGASAITSHGFFEGIDWDVAGKMGLCPPFLPRDDGDILADQPLPRYQDFLRGATAPLISDHHPEFYFLSPALGGESSHSPSLQAREGIVVDEAYSHASPTQALEAKLETSTHSSETLSAESVLRSTAKLDPIISVTQEGASLFPSPLSKPESSDRNASIPLSDTVHPTWSATEEDHNNGASRIKTSGILNWLVSVGRKLLRSFKHCYKTMPVA